MNLFTDKTIFGFINNIRKNRKLLILIFSLLISFLGSMVLDNLGFPIFLIRQITGIILFTFIPGFLFLRIIKVKNLNYLENFVYSVGISIFIIMFTGFFINIAYPLVFGNMQPISEWPFVLTITVVILFFLIFAGGIEYPPGGAIKIKTSEFLTSQFLFLSLLPLFAIIGTYAMNRFNINIILVILLSVIIIFPIMIEYNGWISEKYYPYAIFCIALALLFHTSLISNHIWGWDIQYEYYLLNTVINESFWDMTMTGNVSAMLSVMLLVPFYSNTLNLDPIWILKILYPIIFALVPLGLYYLYKNQTNDRIALYACFFFVSVFVFFTEMIGLARQQIAELFLVLILLVLINDKHLNYQRSALLLIFFFSIVVSHYGTAYIFSIILYIAFTLGVMGLFFSNWTNRHSNQKKYAVFINKFGISNWIKGASFNKPVIPIIHVVIYGLIMLIWYIYMTGSSAFNSVVRIADNVLFSNKKDLMIVDSVQGMVITINPATSLLKDIWKFLHIVTIIFIIIGYFISIRKNIDNKFDIKYMLFGFGALSICVGGITLPFFASALNTSRLYHLSLIILAPYCIIGGITLIWFLIRRISYINIKPLKIISIILAIFLFFNCGYIFEISHDEPISFSLNSSIDYPKFNNYEVFGAKWLVSNKDNKSIEVDRFRQLLFEGFIGRSGYAFPTEKSSEEIDTYLFLGTNNIENNRFSIGHKNLYLFFDEFSFCKDRGKIYVNGGTIVLN